MRVKILAACLILMSATLASGFQTEWVRFAPEEWRCSALMPQQPTVKSQEAAAATGTKFTQHLAQASDADSVYMISYFDYPTDLLFSLDKGRDGMVSAVNGTLLSETSISLGGNPGRELKVATTSNGVDLLIRARFYNIGNRVYVLQHMTTKANDTPAITAKTTRFFDSFKVTTSK